MMLRQWKMAALGDVIELLDHKRVPLNGGERRQRQGPYPYYGAQGIIDSIDDYRYEGDHILLAEDGENLNSRKLPLALRASGKFWVNNHAHVLRGLPGMVDDTFLLAAINNTDIKPFVTGAAQPKLSQANLRLMEIPLPPLAVQRRIAGILSTYDALIENYGRRIRVLDEMGRAVYREWFVLFRYPNREKTLLVDSPLGRIPKGWEFRRLDTLTTKIGSGATPRGGKEAYQSEGISLIRSLNIYDDRFELANLAFISQEQARLLENVSVEQFDVLLNITGASVARCTMVPAFVLPARVNQHVAIVRADPSRMDPHLLLDSINSESNKARLLALAQGGATREALTKETIARFEILVPSDELVHRYGKIARPSHAARETLRRQADTLRETRDLLLPRLLSGQLSVEAAA